MKTFAGMLVAILVAANTGCDGSGGSAPSPKPPTAAKPRPTPSSQTPSISDVPTPTWHVSTSTDDSRVAQVGGIDFPKPPTWTWQPVSMRFRTLQYQVPGKVAGEGAAQLVFSLFLGDDGGPTDMNIQRWVGQFRSEDGEPSTPVLGTIQGDGFTVKTVETAGSYQAMGAPAPRTGQRQLGAIVEAPGRRVFVRVVGPESTVAAAREDFARMLSEAKIVSN